MHSVDSIAVGSFNLRVLSPNGSPTAAHTRRIILNVEVLREKEVSAGDILLACASGQDNPGENVRVDGATR